MKKIKAKKIYFILPVILLIIIGLIYFFSKLSSAIYYTKENWNYSFSSSKMYISSDLLVEGNTTMEMLNYDYSKINFKVNNFESDTQISTKNITYSIACSTNYENYKCYIDNIADEIINQTLNRSYECSISGYTEEQCSNDSDATLTYNKATNTHNFFIKKISGTTQNNINVSIVLTTSSPYNTVLRKNIAVSFDDTNKNVVIEKIGESNFQCEYQVSNYKDTNSLCFSTKPNSDIRFMANNSTQLCIDIEKYSKKTIKVFKKSTDTCTNGISWDYS